MEPSRKRGAQAGFWAAGGVWCSLDTAVLAPVTPEGRAGGATCPPLIPAPGTGMSLEMGDHPDPSWLAGETSLLLSALLLSAAPWGDGS